MYGKSPQNKVYAAQEPYSLGRLGLSILEIYQKRTGKALNNLPYHRSSPSFKQEAELEAFIGTFTPQLSSDSLTLFREAANTFEIWSYHEGMVVSMALHPSVNMFHVDIYSPACSPQWEQDVLPPISCQERWWKPFLTHLLWLFIGFSSTAPAISKDLCKCLKGSNLKR